MQNPRLAHLEARVMADQVRDHAIPLMGEDHDFDRLVARARDARFVLLGEATHGTAEFYSTRARLSRRLIAELGFNLVAVEGDWPDSLHVNRFILGGPGTARESLDGFFRFPTWMWRNSEVLRFVEWLRHWNDEVPPAQSLVRFYGLDVYSLHASMRSFLQYLEATDPPAADATREHFQCFEPFGADTQQYAMSAHFLARDCEEAVVTSLLDFMKHRHRYAEATGEEAAFETELNGWAILHAERYYRRMAHGGAVTWNLRDRHMADTLARLVEHMGPRTKAIVWEHNSHIGDFRATYDGRSDHVNVGQLLRERYPGEVMAVGFGTYQGTVTAARQWDGDAEFMRMPPARAGSYESVFHAADLGAFALDFGAGPFVDPDHWSHHSHDERAIGVVYDPRREHQGNYVPSRIADRYDAFLFHDTTLAVEPLDLGTEPPGLETYPSGL